MKNFLKILLLGIFAFVAFPSEAQPPGYPPAHENLGRFNTPLAIYKDVVIWTVTNHTNCNFKYKLFFSFSNNIGQTSGSGTTGNNYQMLPPNQETEWNISKMFMDNYADWSYLTNMSMELDILGWKYYAYPKPDGEPTICTILDGLGDCSCFKIEFHESTRTIDILPCN